MEEQGRERLDISFAEGGFYCAGCADDVETFLRETEGVLDVEAVYREDMVRILFDPGRISKKDILERLIRTGFKPRPVER